MSVTKAKRGLRPPRKRDRQVKSDVRQAAEGGGDRQISSSKVRKY